MLTRKQYALVKIETTAGEDATPDLSNRIEAVNEFSLSPYEGDTQTQQRYRDHLGGNAEVNVGPYTKLTITVPLAGSGTAGAAPSFGPLLRACGLSETADLNSVAYAPVSADFETVTIYFVMGDDQLHKITNAIGTPTYNLSSGEFPTVQFEMMGVYNRPEAVGSYSGVVPDQAGELPVNSRNTTISVHGFNACGQSYELNQNNTTIHRNLIGCESFTITERDANGSVQVDAPDLATQDYFKAVESHEGTTTGAIEVVHGATPGNIVTLSEPTAQLSTISIADQDGVVQYSMNHKALPADGDDEFTLEFS